MLRIALKVHFWGIICSALLLQCRPDPKPAGVSVSVRQPQLPVLIHKTDNPILRITIETDTIVTLAQFQLSTTGTSDLADLEAVRMFYTGADTVFVAEKVFGGSREPAENLSFSQEMLLVKGRHHFFVSCQLNNQADLVFQKIPLKEIPGL